MTDKKERKILASAGDEDTSHARHNCSEKQKDMTSKDNRTRHTLQDQHSIDGPLTFVNLSFRLLTQATA